MAKAFRAFFIPAMDIRAACAGAVTARAYQASLRGRSSSMS